MNDNFIHDYWSIYTTKRRLKKQMLNNTNGQQMLIVSLASYHGFTLHQNNKETKA